MTKLRFIMALLLFAAGWSGASAQTVALKSDLISDALLNDASPKRSPSYRKEIFLAKYSTATVDFSGSFFCA